MPRWTTRWLAWARDNLFRRARPRAVGAAVGYERAGLARWETPVPWTADAVVVDVQLALPPAARRKTDFAFRLPTATFPADALRPDADHCRVTFRFPVPSATLCGDLVWKGRAVASVAVHVLTPDSFLTGLTLTNPTVAVRFGGVTVAATAFVSDRCDGLLTAAVLRASHTLAPLSELGLHVSFRDALTGRDHVAEVKLGAAQLARPESLVTAVCPAIPHEPGAWWVTWTCGTRTLAAQRVHALPAERFDADVRLLETRFALLDPGGGVRTTKLPPAFGDARRAGPCFVLAAGEPGCAALCHFTVVGIADGRPDPLLRCDADAVVTDGPTLFVPALFDVADVGRASGFELRLNGRLLGVASLRPVPAAALTAEGGFAPPPEFVWSAAAEDELADRLRRLQ